MNGADAMVKCLEMEGLKQYSAIRIVADLSIL